MNHKLDELLLMPLNEEVFGRILEILEQMQQTDLATVQGAQMATD